tara:strand:- start:27 stop:272 length:246 start_codon:yes stop_codon:yes gene_type:complete
MSKENEPDGKVERGITNTVDRIHINTKMHYQHLQNSEQERLLVEGDRTGTKAVQNAVQVEVYSIHLTLLENRNPQERPIPR